ncbi:MAG: acetyl-CoA hydrolase/transferase family protein [Rhodospirillales bacterium]|jgi:4-hydroxybutyrate CoA-transferase|nr:acetyl-CoA hydrolase/transferase family protein [Rhodospirillales bacterium]MBT4039358.1 acetyl-CoA hydrolase/transferase family protein [Rhodospirillales bacterium]MBT4626240.1 acetyl-CoA hydrolase/transferase family protein [Rhodospirillales bacterium]MBT5353091.1 acetyl-CoA hydrolase/transferase family protein [Rhodospirillales bacterium]MBT5520778.1 acetyl-CoA hydrolase/transferase family protein [Rhodospirillales bacterium]
MTNWVEADQVAELLKPGMTVFVAGATAEPSDILDALGNSGDACAGVHFISISVPGMNGVDFSSFHPDARSTAFFATPQNRDSMAAGRVDYLPLQYRAIYDYLECELDIDAVIVQLPPADEDGMISHGISADFLPAVLGKAKLVIGEINARQPLPVDSLRMPADRLTHAVKTDRAILTFPVAKAGDATRAIGASVAQLINDGDCLQIGIGAIPDATLAALTDKNDLKFHSGMITDGVMALANAGNIKGTLTTGATLGSQKLIDWVGKSERLSFRPVNHTHDPGTLRQIDNFVSINSALEIDLFGQINADVLGGSQVSGTGGSVDMMRGAALSNGGRSIIALNATASGGTVSRIVPALTSNTPATALRSDIDYVVTEFGAQRIKHLPVQARAEALIELAAPEFRHGLRTQWKTLTSV